MLLWRAKELLEGSGDLLRAEAELASMRIKRMLVGMVFLALAGLVGLIGLGMILAGITVSISRELGMGPALAIVGGGVTAVCLIAWGVIALRRKTDDDGTLPSDTSTSNPTQTQEEPSPSEAAQEAKEKMKDAATPGTPKNEPKIPGDLHELKDAAIDFATKNPMAVGSAALLALSVVGPGRTLRLISRGVAAAGLVGTVLDAMQSDDESGKGAANESMASKPTPPGTTAETPPPARPTPTPGYDANINGIPRGARATP